MQNNITSRDSSVGLYSFALARITLGLILLQQFLDKTFGMGGTTCRNLDTGTVSQGCSEAWAHGGSPSIYFLQNNAAGPLEDWIQAIAGNPLTDVVLMTILLLVSLSLIFGVLLRAGAVIGSIFLLFLWLVSFQPANPPYVHIPLIFFLIGTAALDDSQKFGLGNRWRNTTIVKRFQWLK